MTAGESAGFARRCAALLYDALLLAGLLMVYTAALLYLTHGRPVLGETVGEGWAGLYRLSLLGICGLYFVGNWMHSGQTLGMRAWRLRVVDGAGRRLRLGRAVLRWLYALLAWAPAGLGVAWLYFDPQRLALHDRLAGTRLVLLPRVQVPP